MARGDADTDQLIEQAAAGDRVASELLLTRHRGRLRKMIAIHMDARLAPRVDPSDVVQETLLTASRRLEQYLQNRPVVFYAWLRQLAWQQLMHTTHRHLNAQKRSVRREVGRAFQLNGPSSLELARMLVSRSRRSADSHRRGERLAEVRAALDRVDARHREVLVLRYLEQLSTNETADVLQISAAAVKMRHLRAIEALRNILRDHADGDSHD